MPDYRRILSYLYRYENGDKKACKGFVKAEQRDGNLKLTIQVQDQVLVEDMSFALCFYHQSDGNWHRILLGHPVLKIGQEDTVLHYDRTMLPDHFDIQKQYGLLLYYQNNLCYGSVWIGDEIPGEVLGMGPDEEGASPGDEAAAEIAVAESMPQDITSGEKKFGVPDKTETTERTGMPEKTETTEGIGAPKKSGTAEEAETVSTLLVKEEQESEEVSAGLKLTEVRQEPEEDCAELRFGDSDLLTAIRDQASTADNIHNSALYEGYQIVTGQLMQMGPEADRLSENQFLLKGYGRYGHLLAGKVLYDGEDRICVGVPGIYENREKYMAQLYQFPIFLSASEDRVKTGRFGYWLHLLSDEVL